MNLYLLGKVAIKISVSDSFSPCWATVQLLWVVIGGKAWASAKATVWATGLGWLAAQTSESEFEGAGVRSLWETPRFAPPL